MDVFSLPTLLFFTIMIRYWLDATLNDLFFQELDWLAVQEFLQTETELQQKRGENVFTVQSGIIKTESVQ